MAYLDSNKIKVFPSAYRDEPTDATSSLTTEGHLVDTAIACTDRNVFVKEDEHGNLIIVFQGYRFTAQKNDIIALFPSSSAIYAKARIYGRNTADASPDYYSPTLTGGESSGTDFNPDSQGSFTALDFTDTSTIGYYKILEKVSSVWEIPVEVRLVLNEESIATSSALSMSINQLFRTNKLENGENVSTNGEYSHAEGNATEATGDYSHAEGTNTEASGNYSHAEGSGTQASGGGSHAEGYDTKATSHYAHAEGWGTQANYMYAHSEGLETVASEEAAHAEGAETAANGRFSHAEGMDTLTSGNGSHAEGYGTKAASDYSHAEGSETQANSLYAHSEGIETIASGEASHAEGNTTQASGDGSHAEGDSTLASGDYSHAEGIGTIASGEGSHAAGKYNVSSYTHLGETHHYIESIGGGTDDSHRSNLRSLDEYGNEKLSGILSVGGDIVGSGNGTFMHNIVTYSSLVAGYNPGQPNGVLKADATNNTVQVTGRLKVNNNDVVTQNLIKSTTFTGNTAIMDAYNIFKYYLCTVYYRSESTHECHSVIFNGGMSPKAFYISSLGVVTEITSSDLEQYGRSLVVKYIQL